MELVYLITTACNYRCQHCNSSLWMPKINELSADEFIQYFEHSEIMPKCSVSISGGEPFLKRDIEKLVAYLNERRIMCSITTNGRFTDKIKSLISRVQNKEYLHFAVSVDGDETTHDKIRGGVKAYRHALETVQLLIKNGFGVQINMVIQKDNYPILESIGKEFEEMGAELNYIPRVAYEENEKEIFSPEEMQEVYRYLKYNREKKLLLSGGKYKIKNCHAGESAWLLDSNGDLYTCYGCLSFKNKNDYLLGNLRDRSFDELAVFGEKENIYKTVKSCKGCAWPCEIVREVDQYGLSTEVTLEEEQIFWEQLTNCNTLENYELDNESWHDLEQDENGQYRWMCGSKASAFLRVPKKYEYTLKIRFVNMLEQVDQKNPYIRCYINDLLITEAEINVGMNEIVKSVGLGLYDQIVKITIETNVKWQPDKMGLGNDTRVLGLAVYSIEMN